jgi:small subunit ribosomal protein S20
MPQTKSASKRLRQNEKRRLQNRSDKRSLRTLCRRVREALQAGDPTKAETEFRMACKRFDQAGAKGVIHPNVAARTKSRLSALIRKFKAGNTQAVQESTIGKNLG